MAAAHEHGSPPHSPSLFRTTPHQWHLRPRTCLGKSAQDGACLIRPSSADLHSQDHQLGSTVRADQLRIRGDLLAFGCPQRDPVLARCSSSWSAIRMQRTHQNGVHCQLGTAMHRKSVNHHLQSAPVAHWNIQIYVPDEHVGSDPSTSLATDPCGHSPVRIRAGPTSMPAHKLLDDGH